MLYEVTYLMKKPLAQFSTGYSVFMIKKYSHTNNVSEHKEKQLETFKPPANVNMAVLKAGRKSSHYKAIS
jgi:hypothetical protein